MTNSSELSHKKPSKLIIIHGLNNKTEAFAPLVKHYRELGWDIEFVTLPCHGSNREEASNFEEALTCFDQRMQALTTSPYCIIAFSQGALYLQLWLERNPDKSPIRQVLLAPALYIRRHWLVEGLMSIFPPSFHLKSFSPKEMRRYESLSVREYHILLKGLQAYQSQSGRVSSSTLVLIDPKDELVDAKVLKRELTTRNPGILSFEVFPRKYLKKGLGRHHILFHPDYFSGDDWKKFTHRIDSFLKD